MNAYVKKHDRCCDLAKSTNYSRSSRAGRHRVAKYGKSQEERLACSRFFRASCFPGIKTNHCRVKVNLSITVQIVASSINVGHISELQCKVWWVLVHHILESIARKSVARNGYVASQCLYRVKGQQSMREMCGIKTN